MILYRCKIDNQNERVIKMRIQEKKKLLDVMSWVGMADEQINDLLKNTDSYREALQAIIEVYGFEKDLLEWAIEQVKKYDYKVI